MPSALLDKAQVRAGRADSADMSANTHPSVPERILAMSPAECVFEYGGFSSGFVNGYLRGASARRWTQQNRPELIAEAQVLVRGIDAAMNSCFPHAFEVWRGERSGDGAPLQVGQLVRDNGYLSTSLFREIAEEFAHGDVPHLWQIHVPAEVAHADVAALSSAVDADHCLLARGEQEILIHRKSLRRVDRITHVDLPRPYLIVEATIVS